MPSWKSQTLITAKKQWWLKRKALKNYGKKFLPLEVAMKGEGWPTWPRGLESRTPNPFKADHHINLRWTLHLEFLENLSATYKLYLILSAIRKPFASPFKLPLMPRTLKANSLLFLPLLLTSFSEMKGEKTISSPRNSISQNGCGHFDQYWRGWQSRLKRGDSSSTMMEACDSQKPLPREQNIEPTFHRLKNQSVPFNLLKR